MFLGGLLGRKSYYPLRERIMSRQTIIVVWLIVSAIQLGGCASLHAERNMSAPVLAELPAQLDMSNIDQVLDRADSQFIDLRSAKEVAADGLIEGFAVVAFFEDLDGHALLRNGSTTFQPEHLTVQAQLVFSELFDQQADAVLLMCRSGARAAYVKAALEYLGYSNVRNIGGIKDYQGSRKVGGAPSVK